MKTCITILTAICAAVSPVSLSATTDLYSLLHRQLSSSHGRSIGHKISGRIPRPVYPTLDLTLQAMSVDEVHSTLSSDQIPFTGRGVTIAVIDGGIDPRHIAFSKGGEEGTSRVVRYLFTESALESDDATLHVKTYDNPVGIPETEVDLGCGGHGTHTSGIALGADCGLPFYGIAPEASLLAVSMGDNIFDDEIEAGIRAANEYAQVSGSPLVMNFSLGSAVGSHRGNSPITEIFTEYPAEGRIPVFAAGNDGINGLSLQRDFSTDSQPLSTGLARTNFGTAIQQAYIEAYSADEREFEISIGVLRLTDGYKIVYQSPYISAKDFSDVGLATLLNSSAEIDSEKGIFPELRNYFTGAILAACEPDNDGVFSMALLAKFEGVEADYPYTLTLSIRSPQGADVMAISDYSSCYFRKYGMEGFTAGNPLNSISDYCTSPNVISVGSRNMRESFTDINGQVHPLNQDFYGPYLGVGAYSSYGYTRTPEARKLPHILAPGTDVISSVFPDYKDGIVTSLNTGLRTYYWGAMTGTSMATPAAAGVIALWLQASPSLTRDEIIDIIEATASHDTASATSPGGSAYGNLDAYEGLKYILTNLSVPGVTSPDAPSGLLIRHPAPGEIECVPPFLCTSGRLEAFSMQGASVATAELSAGVGRLQLPQGIYIISLTSPQGKAQSKVIIQ